MLEEVKRPATPNQIKFLKQLNIEFKPDISQVMASIKIKKAIRARDLVLKQTADGRKKMFSQMREKILYEPRISAFNFRNNK